MHGSALLTFRPSQPHGALRGKASGDDVDGRAHEEQGDAVDSWNPPSSGRPGGQKEYSDVAIETALTLRSLFHHGLRQTEGFVDSLVRLMGLELCVPDQWRKLHLGIDLGGFIVVSALTARSEDDGCVGVELLGRLGAPVASFRADGAYDTRAVYAALDEVRAEQIDMAIPPRRTASSSRPGVGAWRQREAALRRINDVGRRQWRKESVAHQQARAENGMVRLKQIHGALASTGSRGSGKGGDDRREHPQPNDRARDAGVAGRLKLKLRESRTVERSGLTRSRATTPRT